MDSRDSNQKVAGGVGDVERANAVDVLPVGPSTLQRLVGLVRRTFATPGPLKCAGRQTPSRSASTASATPAEPRAGLPPRRTGRSFLRPLPCRVADYRRPRSTLNVNNASSSKRVVDGDAVIVAANTSNVMYGVRVIWSASDSLTMFGTGGAVEDDGSGMSVTAGLLFGDTKLL